MGVLICFPLPFCCVCAYDSGMARYDPRGPRLSPTPSQTPTPTRASASTPTPAKIIIQYGIVKCVESSDAHIRGTHAHASQHFVCENQRTNTNTQNSGLPTVPSSSRQPLVYPAEHTHAHSHKNESQCGWFGKRFGKPTVATASQHAPQETIPLKTRRWQHQYKQRWE